MGRHTLGWREDLPVASFVVASLFDKVAARLLRGRILVQGSRKRRRLSPKMRLRRGSELKLKLCCLV
ncbi:hypothetical protein I3760_13G129000 [Carya illinoinensis]|nr:hypothetical protein I3760_13G129000 [Carya illinoinensis]